MSRKQRRDHRVIVGVDSEGAAACVECGDRIERVYVIGYDRAKPVSERRTENTYWRHVRRWYRRPRP